MIDSILIAYLFLYFIFQYLQNKNWLSAHQTLMSIFASFYLFFTVLNIVQQWYTGYLSEILAFYEKAIGGVFFSWMVGEILVFVILLLNWFSKNKRSSWRQWLINASITAYLLLKYWLDGFSIAVISGWHTTIYPSLAIYSFIISISAFLFFDFLFLKSRFNKNNGS